MTTENVKENKENGAFILNCYGIVKDLFDIRFDVVAAFAFDVKRELIPKDDAFGDVDYETSPFCTLHENIADFINNAISSGKVQLSDLTRNASYLMLEPIKGYLEPRTNPLMMQCTNSRNVSLPCEYGEDEDDADDAFNKSLYNALVYVPAVEQKEDIYGVVYSGLILYDKVDHSVRFQIYSGLKYIDTSIFGLLDIIIIKIHTFLHKLNPKNWFRKGLDLDADGSTLSIQHLYYANEEIQGLYRADQFPESHFMVDLEVDLETGKITDYTNSRTRFI